MSLVPVVGKIGVYRDSVTGQELSLADVIVVEVVADTLLSVEQVRAIAVERLARIGWVPEKLAVQLESLRDDGKLRYLVHAKRPLAPPPD